MNESVVQPEVEPVRVKAGGEVHDVEVALNKVQDSAVSLAVEQATLRRNIADAYVNLGRRNQNLLSRQLEFITQLENDESDPETLEHLFRLDHLATRMRRNAESLLVLAGLAPPRTWSAPVAMGDVVRGALGEVEGYRRVRLRHVDDARVDGAAAADVSHVIAELVENALSFSPPDADVEVYGRRDDHGYVITIVDSGIGMHDEELERANALISSASALTLAPSRFLGHYVVAQLAARHGLVVHLAASPAGGLTAMIALPGRTDRDEERARSSRPTRGLVVRARGRPERASAARAAPPGIGARPRSTASPRLRRSRSRSGPRRAPRPRPAARNSRPGRRRCDSAASRRAPGERRARRCRLAARVRRRRRRGGRDRSHPEVAHRPDAEPEPVPVAEAGRARAGTRTAPEPASEPAEAAAPAPRPSSPRARLVRRPAGCVQPAAAPVAPPEPPAVEPAPARGRAAARRARSPTPIAPAVVAPDRRPSFAEVAQAVDAATGRSAPEPASPFSEDLIPQRLPKRGRRNSRLETPWVRERPAQPMTAVPRTGRAVAAPGRAPRDRRSPAPLPSRNGVDRRPRGRPVAPAPDADGERFERVGTRPRGGRLGRRR